MNEAKAKESCAHPCWLLQVLVWKGSVINVPAWHSKEALYLQPLLYMYNIPHYNCGFMPTGAHVDGCGGCLQR